MKIADLAPIIATVASGSRLEIKHAKKQLEGFFHYTNRRSINDHQMSVLVQTVRAAYQDAPSTNQAALLHVLSYLVWHAVLNRQNELLEFIFLALDNDSGTVRLAAVNLADNAFRIAFVLSEDDFLYRKQISPEVLRHNRQTVRRFYRSLINHSRKERAKLSLREREKEYLDDLAPSKFKSYQLAAHRVAFYHPPVEKVLREAGHDLEQEIMPYNYDDYETMSPEETSFFEEVAKDMDNLAHGKVSRLHHQPETATEIEQKRSDIEQRLKIFLHQAGSPFQVADVAALINNEQTARDFGAMIQILSNSIPPIMFEEFVSLISDAWNYFPHQCLGGLSPAQKVLEMRLSDINT